MSRPTDPHSDETDRWTRRQVLRRGGALAAALLTGAAACTNDAGCRGRGERSRSDASDAADSRKTRRDADASPEAPSDAADDARQVRSTEWMEVRRQFDADPDVVHMAGMLLATHPKPVREAIERHRRGLNDNPVGYLFDHWARSGSASQLDDDGEQKAMRAAARYLDVEPANVAITDSTTEGLATIYNGLDIGEDQEVLYAHWNHWATEGSLEYRADKTDLDVRRVELYDDIHETSRAELTDRLVDEIDEKTRAIALTWVHSTTGLKLPVGAIGRHLEQLNRERSEEDRILLVVDGVHGLGVERFTFDDLGCDFFIAGCHKWLFGPRGTGIIAAAPDAWKHATPTIPSFSMDITQGRRFTPGGFKPYEHVWALPEAFDFHMNIGKGRIAARIKQLTDHLYDGLDAMSHVSLLTPANPDLRAAILTFDVDGHGPYEVIDHLRRDDIVASMTPGDLQQPRLTPGLLNDHVEVEMVLESLSKLG